MENITINTKQTVELNMNFEFKTEQTEVAHASGWTALGVASGLALTALLCD